MSSPTACTDRPNEPSVEKVGAAGSWVFRGVRSSLSWCFEVVCMECWTYQSLYSSCCYQMTRTWLRGLPSSCNDAVRSPVSFLLFVERAYVVFRTALHGFSTQNRFGRVGTAPTPNCSQRLCRSGSELDPLFINETDGRPVLASRLACMLELMSAKATGPEEEPSPVVVVSCDALLVTESGRKNAQAGVQCYENDATKL